jgi:hypothetical protein
VAGDGDPAGDRGCGAEAIDVGRDGRRRVENRVVTQSGLVRADQSCVVVAEVVVGEGAGSALGVVDDSDLEQRSFRHDVLGELPDEGDVLDHLRRDAPAAVADDHRVAEVEAEHVGRVDPRVEASNHEQAQGGEDGGALVAAGAGEGVVAGECGLDARALQPIGPDELELSRPACRRAEDHGCCCGLFAHRVLSPLCLSCH